MSEFVEVKTAELVGPALDWAVAKCSGMTLFTMGEDWPGNYNVTIMAGDKPVLIFDLVGRMWREHQGITVPWSPSTDWAQGGPLIERELIEVSPRWHNQHCAVNQDWEKRGFKADHGWHWGAYVLGADNIDDNHEQEGGAPLIAAMRCIVAAKLGDVVQVPSVRVEVYR